ncbi:winged helix-turn-helix transcriptional regulator [Actinokineospora iranica]|uniref:DNA-binding transcriptional regulator, HxlR family n=1 Tax=Actinokineospora iranica TaxID=1271860 RepID=A0A1G6UCI5_9PSEU|nr:helix-turn-helix domain-containing protein [Actinokineospora iranica]SDD38959.1 DNA-binding transcriptional regulator, HxlR family [Actinokineospora iranica]
MSVHYGQHCAVARASELLGETWTLLVVRELLRGAQRVEDIARGLPRISRSLLATRLRTLVAAGIAERMACAERASPRYRLTEAGQELRPVVEALRSWGRRWLPEPRLRDLDPALLVADICRVADTADLPGPVSVRVDFADARPRERWWLALATGGSSARDTPPAEPASVRVVCTLGALARVWLGHGPLLEAVRDRSILITGELDHVRTVVAVLARGGDTARPGPPDIATVAS